MEKRNINVGTDLRVRTQATVKPMKPVNIRLNFLTSITS